MSSQQLPYRQEGSHPNPNINISSISTGPFHPGSGYSGSLDVNVNLNGQYADPRGIQPYVHQRHQAQANGHGNGPYPVPYDMVYPPPPPHHAGPHPSNNSNGQGHYDNHNRLHMSSTSTFAPPTHSHNQGQDHYGSTHPHNHAPPMYIKSEDMSRVTSDQSNPSLNIKANAKRPRHTPRRPSNEEEVEAGFALAGLGLGLSPIQVRERRDSLLEQELEDPPKPIIVPATSAAAKKGAKGGKGAKSCSECRRLKAKCDRVFPCSNCKRRGCALICPEGDLSCMQGKRLVLASTEQLHNRITQLESALSQAHSKSSNVTHPLLATDYLDGGFTAISPKNVPPPLSNSHSSSSPDGLSSSFRIQTPTMPLIPPMEHRSTSHSRMAVESLLLSEDAAVPGGRKDAEWVGENAAPAFIIGTAMPTEGDAKENIVRKLQELHRILPSREETKRRARQFFDSCKWFTGILRLAEFETVYEPAVYEPSAQNPLSPHKLAVVLMVLTIETFLDVTTEEDNPMIARYWEAAQQCFDTRFGWAASVPGIQALALATFFVTFGWRGARASNFFWLRQTTSAILQMGLHKDPHPSLSQSEQDLRRRVFWEAFTMDALLSINHGQRPAIYVETVETLEPSDAPEAQRVKYQYMRSVKLNVLDIGCRPDSSPASQEQLQATYDSLRLWEPASIPHVHCPVLAGGLMPELAADPMRVDMNQIHLSMSSLCHYKAAMFLFRPSLRRLLARIRSCQSGSIVLDEMERRVVTTTADACRAITLLSKYMTRTHPRLTARLWSIWVQVFSAAVSMAALAIWCGRYMDQGFIESAYKELCDACDMIRDNRSHRSRNVEPLLPVLQSLVVERYPYLVGRQGPSHIQPEKEDMLFALLGGRIDNPTLSDQPPAPSQAQVQAHTQSQAQAQVPIQVQAQSQTQPQSQNQGNYQPQPPVELVWKQPTPGPGPDPAVQYSQQDYQYAMQAAAGGYDQFDPETTETISAMEIWNRLQSFYEPTPAFWGMGETGYVGGGGVYDQGTGMAGWV